MSECYFKGMVGLKIILNTGNIADLTTLKILYQKPSGTSGEWTAVAESASSLSYTTQAGDIDEAGNWKLQAYGEGTAWQGPGCVVNLNFGDLLHE